MKLGVLFSGGKDSCFACWRAMRKEEVACLITIEAKNPESYMFHTPNIRFARLQAEAMGLPIVYVESEGRKEEEVEDLRKAIEKAREAYGIEGIVSGAIRSVYQAIRIQRVCFSLGLWCFNPLWQANEREYLSSFLLSGFKAIITGVFAEPFDRSWLGREINEESIRELRKLSKKYGINPAGEGGEIETFVFDGPMFRRRIEILEGDRYFEGSAGVFEIKKARLVKK